MSGTGGAFLCCTDGRRAALAARPDLNGIDFLEVDDLSPADLDPVESALYASLPASERDQLLWERRLTVQFVNPLLPAHLASLGPANLRATGGERPDRRTIGLANLGADARSIVLRASVRGDLSPYRLEIVRGPGDLRPPDVFDPQLAGVTFSFSVDCRTDADCLVADACPPGVRPTIDLDYLARDYASFRRLMLDRISSLSPDWRERHAPDLGMTLVEMIAYVADFLAYRQDAVATEAYLGTARRRASVRRHARLVDYPMHDGCNARTWIHVIVSTGAPAAGIILPRPAPGAPPSAQFLTRIDAAPVLGVVDGADAIALQAPEVFEPILVADVRLFRQHDRLDFYTWGEADCCLPAGSTRATLAGAVDTLAVGDVLILEEVLGPRTGVAGDADPEHRHAVRLTSVAVGTDPLGGRFLPQPTNDPVAITEIAWSRADALPFPLCVSASIETAGVTTVRQVSVARGNIVLADHGRTLDAPEPLGTVPAGRLTVVDPAGRRGDGCDTPEPEVLPARFLPRLGLAPLTQAAVVGASGSGGPGAGLPFDPSGPAASAMRWRMADVIPRVRMTGTLDAVVEDWVAARDLLRSGGGDRTFVAEVESDGTTQLRFGDGTNGLRPVAGTAFAATYRVGNGRRGNVGCDAIAHAVTGVAGIDGVRNPLPAAGGTDPETVEDVRRFAPVAFRTQERAVTADDYARMAERQPQVQRAAATFRWTGSWRTAFVTVDPLGGIEPEAGFDPPLPAALEPYRMAGHDLEVDAPRYVPLEVEMQVCARAGYFRSDVARALSVVFSAGVLPDGRRGVFHPDNFTFGQPVYLSPIYEAALGVDGVESVAITMFQRQGTPDPAPLADGRLVLGRLEIARLDNDPSFPERGVFRLDVGGGL